MAKDAKTNENMRVRKIESGIVIDHIPRGKSLKILGLLGVDIDFKSAVSVLMNVASADMGFKDIVKIEGEPLPEEELRRLARVAPEATVNVIKDFKVVQKFQLGDLT